MKALKTLHLNLLILLFFSQGVYAQFPVKIHSHNDYKNRVPFYQAYSQKVNSIEVDLFYENNKFLVGHELKELNDYMTFERLYLNPILQLYKINDGRAWNNSNDQLQLMIEVKSDNTDDFMNALVGLLNKYSLVFDRSKNPNAVNVIITGKNMPKSSSFSKYPSYISFDGDIDTKYTQEELKRIGMFSCNFRQYSVWNGKGSIVRSEKVKLEDLIKRAHDIQKPIRFWGAPDGYTAWNTFYNLNIDFINTDMPEKCTDFFSNWENKNYVIEKKTVKTESKTTNTMILDKATRDFGGFENNKLQLTEKIPTYTPTYKSDGVNRPVKNVILMIGDGMGLAEIVAANSVNNALSIFNMRHIGLISTSALDAYTTDSAGAGSALSSGKQNSNRHINMSDDGKRYNTLCENIAKTKRLCGIVTLGNVADATPAAFYAHNVERDNSEAITAELLNGKIDLLVGSGKKYFADRKDGMKLKELLENKGYVFVDDVNNITSDRQKMICLDHEMSLAANRDNLDLLANATKRAMAKLQSSSEDGFFLMVEGAKIDYAGHANCLPGSIVETLSFDSAVAEALKFADSNGETLVIVTADHETGGLTLIDGDNKTGKITGYWCTNDHTPIMVPVFIYGPQADNFIGKYHNYDLPRKIIEAVNAK